MNFLMLSQLIQIIRISKIFLFAQALFFVVSSLALAQETREEWRARASCFGPESKASAGATYFFNQSEKSLENFENMNPECRKYILGSLLGEGFYEVERAGVEPEDMAPDRDLILNKYLYNASADYQRQVYEEALVELTSNVNPLPSNQATTLDLFQKLAKADPRRVPQVLCRVLWGLGTMDGEAGSGEITPWALGENVESADRLRPLLASQPGLASQVCNFPDEKAGQIRQFTIGYLVDLARIEAEKEKNSPKKQKHNNAPSVEVIRQYSSCSKGQLHSIFYFATKMFRQSQIPSQVYIGQTEGSCSVQGILKIVMKTNRFSWPELRTKCANEEPSKNVTKSSQTDRPTYLFFPSSQIRFQESQTKPIAFSDPCEIAQALKLDPRTYVLTNVQPAPAAPKQNSAQDPSSEGISVQGAYEALRQFFGRSR